MKTFAQKVEDAYRLGRLYRIGPFLMDAEEAFLRKNRNNPQDIARRLTEHAKKIHGGEKLASCPACNDLQRKIERAQCQSRQ